MTKSVPDAATWAAATFAASALPDRRLHERLVRYGGAQAQEPAATTSAVCKGDSAAREGAYRFLENGRVRPEGIEAGPVAKAKADCAGRNVVLMIQDTTSASVKYRPLADEIKSPGSPTGFMVHTTLAVDGDSGYPIGILDQQRWIRPPKALKEKVRDESASLKESARWQSAAERAKEVLAGGDAPFTGRIVSVADREADIYSLLRWHIDEHVGFVIRSKHNRAQADTAGLRIWDSMDGFLLLGTREFTIPQRGGQGVSTSQKEREPRPKRTAQTELWVCGQISIVDPKDEGKAISVNAILVREVNPPAGAEALQWRLLTDQPVETIQDVLRVVGYYEQRWTIEDFHKIWKTGCRVESRPLQDPETVERMLVITAAIGVRLIQLHRLVNAADDDQSCDEVLEEDEWSCLWATTEPKAPLPSSPPSAPWAFRAIAKLGGWYDTKKTNRVGWQTVWRGWFKLRTQCAEGGATRAFFHPIFRSQFNGAHGPGGIGRCRTLCAPRGPAASQRSRKTALRSAPAVADERTSVYMTGFFVSYRSRFPVSGRAEGPAAPSLMSCAPRSSRR